MRLLRKVFFLTLPTNVHGREARRYIKKKTRNFYNKLLIYVRIKKMFQS